MVSLEGANVSIGKNTVLFDADISINIGMMSLF